MPEVYELLEAERIKYAIRLPANRVLQSRIGYLLTRPVWRPAHHVRRSHASFSYQAGSWTKPRRVIAKVEWHRFMRSPTTSAISCARWRRRSRSRTVARQMFQEILWLIAELRSQPPPAL